MFGPVGVGSGGVRTQAAKRLRPWALRAGAASSASSDLVDDGVDNAVEQAADAGSAAVAQATTSRPTRAAASRTNAYSVVACPRSESNRFRVADSAEMTTV